MIETPPTEHDLRRLLGDEAADIPDPSIVISQLRSSLDQRALMVQRARQLRRRRRYAVLSAVGAVLLAGFAVALIRIVDHTSGQKATTSPSGWVTFSSPTYAIRLRYPARWHAAEYPEDSSSFVDALVFFSTEPLHDPCDVSAGSTSCGAEPVANLSRDGIAVSWQLNGFPRTQGEGPAIQSFGGRRTTVDGYPARILTVLANAPCRSIGGTTSIEAAIQAADRLFTMIACLGPDSDQRAAVIKSFHSATFR
jgi:hypothetical protein